MSKIKILFTLPSFHAEEESKEVLDIVERLDKTQYEAWLGVEEGGGDMFDDIIKKGYPIIVEPFTIKASGVIDAYFKSKKMSQEFRKQGFDIWHSFNESSDFTEALVAKASGAKYLYVKKNMNWGTKAWRIKSFLSKAIVARNRTMFDSYFSAKKLRKKTILIKAAQSNKNGTEGMPKEIEVDTKQTPELEVAAFTNLYAKMLRS